MPVDLSPEARADLTSILSYTRRRWGDRQRDAYAANLERALQTLGDNPHIGRPRYDLRSGLRAYHVEHYLIFYRIEPSVIRVDRILHERMDATAAFAE
jgi:toxin ParE1/3/4